MLNYLCSFYIFGYCPLIVLFYYKFLQGFKHEQYYNPNLPDKYKPFQRSDINNWNRLEIYLCAMFLLPIRAVAIISILLVFYAVFFVSTLDFKLLDPWPKKRYQYVRPLLQFLGRCYMFFSGFAYIKQTTVRYSDYEPEYKQTEEDRTRLPSIIVSNHQTWYDTIIYVFKYFPSYVSKESVKHYPVFGGITTNLKSIFVQRENAENRHQVMKDIKDRVHNINSGKLFPPVIIFPEGTTSNGSYLLSFKRGAFESLEPVKICCLKYSERRFNLSQDSVGLLAVTLLSLVQLYNEVEIIEFEGVYNPKHLNLEKYEPEEQWQRYAERVKDIMAKCLIKIKTTSGFRESQEYQNEYLNPNGKKQK